MAAAFSTMRWRITIWTRVRVFDAKIVTVWSNDSWTTVQEMSLFCLDQEQLTCSVIHWPARATISFLSWWLQWVLAKSSHVTVWTWPHDITPQPGDMPTCINSGMPVFTSIHHLKLLFQIGALAYGLVSRIRTKSFRANTRISLTNRVYEALSIVTSRVAMENFSLSPSTITNYDITIS